MILLDVIGNISVHSTHGLMTLPFSLRTRIRRAGGCWVANGCISDFSSACLFITGVLNMACSRVTNHRGLAFRSLTFFSSRLGRSIHGVVIKFAFLSCLLFCAHCGCISVHPLCDCALRSVRTLPALAATVYNRIACMHGEESTAADGKQR